MANFVTMEEMQEQIARLKNIHKRCKKPKALGYKPEKTVRKRLRLRLSKTLASETDFDAKADFSNETCFDSASAPDFGNSITIQDVIRQLKAKLVEYQQDNNIDGTHLLELLQLKAKGRQESKSWDQKLAQESKSWTAERCGLSHQYIQFQGTPSDFCSQCNCKLDNMEIRCLSCRMAYCCDCDHKFHTIHVFHERRLVLHKDNQYLQPSEFLQPNGVKLHIDIPVPCFLPHACSQCHFNGDIKLIPGKKSMIVVTERGRFDLKEACFSCQNCKNLWEATSSDYIKSGFFPSLPIGTTYLFSFDCLELSSLLRHNSASLSERKVIKSLENITKRVERIDTINRPAFNRASREYELFFHECDVKIKRRNKLACKACGEDPLICHADACFKLYRLKSAGKGRQEDRLYGNDFIASSQEIESHIQIINNALPQECKDSENCGGAFYKAAKTESSKLKGLDETGLVMCCCRHGIVLKAANLFVGESYKFPLFMHHLMWSKGYKYFSYDVICQYWKYLVKVAGRIDKFKPLLEETKGVLGSMHGKTHVLPCQIKNKASWKKGLAASDGEDQERLFAHFGPYSIVTKHMISSNRDDHMTVAAYYWNEGQDDKMPINLARRLVSAEKNSEKWRNILNSLLERRGITEEEIHPIYLTICQIAKTLEGAKIDETVELEVAQRSLEANHLMINILRDRIQHYADSCKARTVFRRKITFLKEKSSKLISIINALQSKRESDRAAQIRAVLNSDDDEVLCTDYDTDSQTESNDETEETVDDTNNQSKPYVTESDFQTGVFPWQVNDSFKQDFELVDAFMISKRYEEELVQVPKEMNEFLKQVKNLIELLEQDISTTVYSEHVEERRYQYGANAIKLQEIRAIKQRQADALNLFANFMEIDWHFFEEDKLEIEDEIVNLDC